MNSNRKNRAFTLAEMMVSFVMVAAITSILIGTFKDSGPKENILNYRKTYTTLQQAITQLANDRMVFPNEDLVFMIDGQINADGTYSHKATVNGTTNYFSNVNEEIVENASSTFFCQELTRVLNIIQTPQRGDLPATPNCSANSLNITMANGVQLFNVGGNTFSGEDEDNFISNHIDIIIDTNGRKGPNSTAPTAKRDRFRLRIDFDGKVTTDASWTAENAIFRAGTKAQVLELQTLIDTEQEND